MFCSQCGCKLEEGAKFCSECGSCVESVSVVKSNTPVSIAVAETSDNVANIKTTNIVETTSTTSTTSIKLTESKSSYIRNTTAYKFSQGIAKYLDRYFLDPVVGLVPVVGDASPVVLSLPSIYLALVHLKSIPLALAMIFNVMIDIVLGMIPFYVGNILDFFHKAYKRNMELVDGWLDGDQQKIEEVKSKAVITAVMIVLFCLIIYWLISLLGGIVDSVFGWIGGWFD